MAGVASALKGVRTRYRNTLEREMDKAKSIIESEVSDKAECLASAKICKKLLKSYSEKLTEQMEKVAEHFDEKEHDFVEHVIDEDCEMNFKVENILVKLDSYIEEIESAYSESKGKKPNDKDKLTELEEQMQRVIVTQMEQQREFIHQLERKDEKKHSTVVRLPTLELRTFNGDKLQWCEFWDIFECSVHANEDLSNVQKFTYLQSKLSGEALRAISGLARSNDNYEIAITILKERYGNKQEMVDIHYKELLNTKIPTSKVESMREFLDNVERNLRCLEKLGEGVDQRIFVSMIRSKLPEEVHRQLEFNKGREDQWNIQTLLQHLRDYVNACEKACKNEVLQKTSNVKVEHQNKRLNLQTSNNGANRSSAESLLANNGAPATNQRSSPECKYCNNNHWSDQCLKYKTIQERKRKIRGSCFRCLKLGHNASDCKSNKSCVYCGEFNRHHRSLCPKRFQTEQGKEHVNLSNDNVEENVMMSAGETVFMQTAFSEVKNLMGSRSTKARILFDSGSQRTYISKALADKLGLKAERVEELRVVTFGSSEAKVIKTSVTTLCLRLNNGECLQMKVNIVPVVSGDLQRKSMDIKSIKNFEHLSQSLELADTIPKQNETSNVDLLIGSDYYLDIILSQKIEVAPGLYLLSSKVGWIFTGRTQSDEKVENIPSMLTLTYGKNFTKSPVFQKVDSVLSGIPDLEDFWNLESIGIKEEPNESTNEVVMRDFKDTISFEDGRYHVTWPWKEEDPDLPENKELAFGRLKSTIRKMKRSPDLLKKYDSVIRDQREKGIIEEVEDQTCANLRHYIPHHAVITPKKSTTKLRVVYDASASTKNSKSLNECLYSGPVMLNDICSILMRFRLHKVAMVADIEKAFLQVGLLPSERDVTRFLWLKDINNPCVDRQNIQEYRFTRVPFGIVSSPFLLGATIETHLDTYKTSISDKLKNDIYVDNLITGTESDDDALALYASTKTIFRKASMNMREWLSNSQSVNDSIPIDDRAEMERINVLGYTWDYDSDTISIKQPKEVNKGFTLTKRTVLKRIASVFDPLGFFVPVTLEGKVLLQSVWNKGYDWDDEISDSDIVEKWEEVEKEIKNISNHVIPRHIQFENREKANLLCFCDASKHAYAAVLYLHQEREKGTESHLIFAKTRLAPVKGMTIPKLELMAVLIGVRCLSYVKKQIKCDIQNEVVWTDSKVVLGWINSDKSLPVFVKNRVDEIKKNKTITFNYINTKENPADVATRGATGEVLNKQSLWWYGPEWLKNDVTCWSTETPLVDYDTVCVADSTKIDERNDDVKDESKTTDVCHPPFDIDINRYSSVSKLLRVTAYVTRFIEQLKGKRYEYQTLTTVDIQKAEILWLKHIQAKAYRKEIVGAIAGKATCLQRQLGLQLDGDQLLRCYGRLENADLTEAAKRPLLMPTKDRFTRLVIEKIHKETLHSGVSQTLSKIRQKYWIPRGRSTVKSVLHQCFMCRVYDGGPYKMPPFAPLPAARVQQAPAFSNSGVDYFGPLSIKCTEGVRKVWVCLFCCMVVRAIHLEVVQDMTSEELILCLKRFISQRGTPLTLTSDNAPQFKLSNTALKQVWNKVVIDEEVQTYVAEKGIQWNFIVELAPWMGGFYERLVGVVKKALRKSLGRKLLTLIQLQTLVKEIEAVVNSRPLVYVEDDVNSSMTLTPNHFLTMNPRIGIPEQTLEDLSDPDFSSVETNVEKLLTMWKKGQKLLDTFWHIWREEYLTSLRERYQNKMKTGRIVSTHLPSVGDVVVIKDNIPRGSWKTARIVKLIKSRDGQIRSAKVRLHTGRVLGRPLNLLYPIECYKGDNTESESSSIPSLGRPNYSLNRPTRKAAENARRKLKNTE